MEFRAAGGGVTGLRASWKLEATAFKLEGLVIRQSAMLLSRNGFVMCGRCFSVLSVSSY